MSVATGRIRTEVSDGVGWLVYDNPSKRNAVNRAMLEQLPIAIDELVADDAVRVVVVRGEGEAAFTAGADISELGNRTSDAPPDPARHDEGFGTRELREIPKPVIAMVHGFCMGGGLMVAMAADIRLASDAAVFCVPTARLGVVYPRSAIERLNQLVGPAHASDLLFSARTIDAAEASRMGLVNRVVPKAELEGETLRYAAQIAAGAPLTLRASKLAMQQVLQPPDARDDAAWAAAMQACMTSDDFAEGRRAFAERRPPRFTGH
jgi:enoyl-CoA hydratase